MGAGIFVPAKLFASTLDDFSRAFDELFDDMLERWRMAHGAGAPRHAIVRDYGDRYEVLIALGGVDPDKLDIRVGERTLTVRVPDDVSALCEGSFAFSEPLQHHAVTAKATGGTLAIVLPKLARSRRVRVE